MPPAFNLSHDQTLQFNLLFAIEHHFWRSDFCCTTFDCVATTQFWLTLRFARNKFQTNLLCIFCQAWAFICFKSNLAVRLATYAHTYRLLIFKELWRLQTLAWFAYYFALTSFSTEARLWTTFLTPSSNFWFIFNVCFKWIGLLDFSYRQHFASAEAKLCGNLPCQSNAFSNA